jgi:hypothetical protein
MRLRVSFVLHCRAPPAKLILMFLLQPLNSMPIVIIADAPFWEVTQWGGAGVACSLPRYLVSTDPTTRRRTVSLM